MSCKFVDSSNPFPLKILLPYRYTGFRRHIILEYRKSLVSIQCVDVLVEYKVMLFIVGLFLLVLRAVTIAQHLLLIGGNLKDEHVGIWTEMFKKAV